MQITKNFHLDEFKSKDGAAFPQEVITNIIELAANLQIIRDTLGKAISINSGYRSPAHNAKVKGKPKSQHLLGTAADITVEGMKPKEVSLEIKKLIDSGKIKSGGLKAYATFVHYDIRGKYTTW